MKAVGVIPARYASTRFPGKPLKLLAGKPLLQWVIEGSRSSQRLSEIWVATDHPEIQALAEGLGVKTVMTSSDLPTGSDRVYQALRGENVEVVVNIQGDEPLISGRLLDQLVEPLLADPTLPMATLGRALKEGDLHSPNTAKIVLNCRGEAIYFSRLPIPYSRVDAPEREAVCLKHIGLYAFRKSFLAEFCAQSPTLLESAEGLEQLRALYLGARIRVVTVDHESVGVDTPEDVARVEALLRNRK
ncbi:MAG: 3-deoxy-manno-octulosonate cytidylyltransferase [Bdellovibrionales bacterium]|nr:3-deoxy-manno-octulosonate cytidylyltransferase [Bdellovibrionales bacterium]